MQNPEHTTASEIPAHVTEPDITVGRYLENKGRIEDTQVRGVLAEELMRLLGISPKDKPRALRNFASGSMAKLGHDIGDIMVLAQEGTRIMANMSPEARASFQQGPPMDSIRKAREVLRRIEDNMARRNGELPAP